MTDRDFGRASGLQVFVLILAGVSPTDPTTDRPLLSDEKRAALMRNSRRNLVRETGEDFGFDAPAWHRFLQKSSAFSEAYSHPYGFDFVKRMVREAPSNADLQRILKLLELPGPRDS
jgi:hypothetical protein